MRESEFIQALTRQLREFQDETLWLSPAVVADLIRKAGGLTPHAGDDIYVVGADWTHPAHFARREDAESFLEALGAQYNARADVWETLNEDGDVLIEYDLVVVTLR
ncbi:MAG: hypothetical protein A2Z04_06730 [Chloroflexi bacterium RBG_16_57_9]|nr:MAG: hypothetical protein A2Z04_06730 [Chloroflexi bacterium RBG_16_57_9]